MHAYENMAYNHLDFLGVAAGDWNGKAFPMRQLSTQNKNNETSEIEKTPTVVIRKIRDAILDEVFKPGDWLPELDLAKRFQVSRSPVREALLALEKEGTVTTEPYKGANVKPLSAEETFDIGEIRLALITLAAKGAYRHLSPADFDIAYGLAKQITRSNSAKEQFEYNRHFWDILFEKTGRPILWEVFTRLDYRMTRYYPLIFKLLPNPATRARQHVVLIEYYRKGNVDEGVRAFKKIYLELVHQIVDHLETEESVSD